MPTILLGAIVLLVGNVAASSTSLRIDAKQPLSKPMPAVPHLPPGLPGGLPMFPEQTHRRVTIKDVNGTRDVLIEENSRRLAVHEDNEGIQVEITVTDGAPEKTEKRTYRTRDEWKRADQESHEWFRRCVEERPVFPVPTVPPVGGVPPVVPNFPRFGIPAMPPMMRPFGPAGSNSGGPPDPVRPVFPGAPRRWEPRFQSPWGAIPFDPPPSQPNEKPEIQERQ